MNLTITSTAETKKLIAALKSPQGIVNSAKKKALTTASMIFQGKAIEEAPVSTTNLRKNIKYKVESDGSEARVYVDDKIEYARYQEEGTAAHGPKRAKVLAWKTKSGQWIFAKWVKGIKAKWFMKKGSEEVERQNNKVNEVLYNELKKGLGL